MFDILRAKIKHLTRKRQAIIASLFLFACGTLPFLSGLTNSQTLIEKTSVEITKYIDTNSSCGFLSVQVAPNSREDSKKLPNTYDEYFYWKYIFRKSDYGFLSTANGGKDHLCVFDEFESNDNITFLTCGNNANRPIDDYYKHEVYDLKLLFKGSNNIDSQAVSFFAISQSDASKILEQRGVLPDSSSYSISQYEQLLGTNTSLLVDGEEEFFTISNVFYEDGSFYERVKNTFGSFVLSYIRLPESLTNEATYIFNNFTYQNMHKIRRMRSFFDSDLFSFSVSKYNLPDNNEFEAIDSKVISILQNHIGNNVLSVLITILCFVVSFISFSFVLFCNKIQTLKFFILLMGSFLTATIVFFATNLINPIPIIFSQHSLIVISILFILLISVFLLVLFRKRGEQIRNLL